MSTISATDNTALYSASGSVAAAQAAADDAVDETIDETVESGEAAASSESVESTDDVETTASSEAVEAPNTTTDSVVLSSRAEKIQKLNAEFFPGGPSTVTITPEFIQRLEEYQLISSDAALTLGAATAKSSESNSITKITDAIDEVAVNVKQQDPQSSLIETLSKAKEVIENFGISSAANNHDIKGILAELAEYRQSEQGGWLTDDDKKNFDQIELALNVADQMNPQSSTSDQLDAYVSVYNQTQTS